MNKETFNKRFIDAIDHILKSRRNVNKSAIANVLGVSNSKFSEMLKERMNVGIDSIALICQNFDIRPEYILFGEGEIERKEGSDPVSVKRIPIMRQNEMTGFSCDEMNNCETCGQFYFSDCKQAEFAIRMTNDMMAPKLAPNATVLFRQIEAKRFIQWGLPHALATTQGIIICNPFPGSDNDHIGTQYANERYKSFEIPKSEVKAVAIAVCEIRPL